MYLESKNKLTFFKIRNYFLRLFYKIIFRPIAFLIEPETVHNITISVGRKLGSCTISQKAISLLFNYQNSILEQNILGINFSNPIGLAAGFDKNAYLIDILPYVGFGFIEVGSITGEPCQGNSKPRLWRLKKSKGLLVNYGLANEGAERIAKRLQNKKFKIPIGISIAKTNSPETVDIEKGIDDYLKVCQNFIGIGDYWTINISCPNSFGGEPFTKANNLDKLLTQIDKLNVAKPIFIKLSPDLTESEIDEILDVIKNHKISGFVCSNLTKKREDIIEKNLPQKGGISGKPVENFANRIISYIYRKTKGQYVIIGVGGTFTAEDAYKKIKLGASLVQLITGMIFEGPQLISSINLGLVDLLRKDGYESISQAIGVENK